MTRIRDIAKAVVAAALLAGCNGHGTPDADADDGQDGDVQETLAVYSVDPAQGPPAGGTAVAVLGRGFEEGASVTFGGEPAADVAVVGEGRITLSTPPAGGPGAVDVTVENPDGGTSTLVGGFTYAEQGSGVDWCRLQHPPTITAPVSTEAGPVTGQAYVEGCTETPDEPCEGLVAQVGLGPPSADPASFTWFDAAYNEAFVPSPGDENNDEFVADLTVPDEEGTYVYAFRFGMDGSAWSICDLDGTDDGVSADQLGVLSAVAPSAVEVGWCNLQHPAHAGTVAGVPTEPVYGRVHVAGCTDGDLRCHGLTVQLGHGDPATDPSASPDGFTWVEAAYNAGHVSDDDDEYQARIVPEEDGTYAYVYRVSGDGGETWMYCDADGNDGTAGGFSTGTMGELTVADLAIGWCNLQHPPHTTVEAGTATEPIYGRVYVAGCTDGAARCGGVLAGVGLGGTAEAPSSFAWTEAAYNAGHISDDNDEYAGILTPEEAGTYEYAVRFSGDGGETWTYCDTSGSSDGYSSDDAGVLEAH